MQSIDLDLGQGERKAQLHDGFGLWVQVGRVGPPRDRRRVRLPAEGTP